MRELKTVLPYFRPYRAPMALGMFLVVLANAFTLVQPYLIKLPIDALTGPAGSDPDAIRGIVVTYAILIVAAAIAGGATRYWMREILNGLSRRIEVDLRNDFVRHLLRLGAGFYSANRTGDLMSLATNDTLAVRQAAGPAVMYTANTVISFVIGLAVMIHISPWLTLAALVPLVALPPLVTWFGKVIHVRFERIQEQFAALSTMVQENLSGVRIVRAYGQEDAQAAEFAALNQGYLQRNMHLAYASGAFHPIMGLLTGAGTVVVLWYGGGQVMAGRIGVGDFVAFSLYLSLLAWPMIALGWVVNLFQRGAASMARLNRIFTIEPEIAAPPAPHRPPGRAAAIEFRDVSFRYPGTDRLVLEDVSFTAEPGRTIAIVGPTASGKSTLVSLIARVYDPTAGDVLLGGVPLPAYDPADIRARIGFAPQDTFLFSARLGRNIALGLPPTAPYDVIKARVRVA
ncbi:MAG: ATP-binding cassette domain-containing protein, partial [Gemmatimonadetes bacterium]|nr:ATP-binding cassette domain-containing protein [Gemmatimonadota bacterium]